MLHLQILKEENSALGMKVRALAKELLGVESLQTFKSNFLTEAKRINTGNHTHADTQYVIYINNEFTKNELLQIVHRASSPSKPDVVVMQLYKK